MSSIAINEMFHSIQGEGPNCGLPSVFIRFQGCQLRCPWCDTSGSLDPNDPHEKMSISSILERISRWPSRHVVITGGDPSFQPEGLDRLSSALKEEGYSLEMETSGLRLVDKAVCDRFSRINVGLKLPNNQQQFAASYYRRAAAHYGPMPRAGFKIVITSEDDVAFLMEELIEPGMLRRETVHLMPLGDTLEQQIKHAPMVIAACRDHGFRFSPRLHIMFGQR